KNSYGFRQQRSCADAMVQCFLALRSANTQWILEGDIKSCFDKISHDWLLAHALMDRVILQKWLKSGYMEKHVLHDTTDGTRQGQSLRTWSTALISSDKTCADILTGNCSSSLPRRMLGPSWTVSDESSKTHMACLPPI